MSAYNGHAMLQEIGVLYQMYPASLARGGGVVSEHPVLDSARWHPSWIRYAEYNGKALILHHGPHKTTYLCLCLISAEIPPSDRHTDQYWQQSYDDDAESEAEAIAAFEAAESLLLAESEWEDVKRDESCTPSS